MVFQYSMNLVRYYHPGNTRYPHLAARLSSTGSRTSPSSMKSPSASFCTFSALQERWCLICLSYMVSEGRMRLSSSQGRSVRMVLFLLFFFPQAATVPAVLEKGGRWKGTT